MEKAKDIAIKKLTQRAALSYQLEYPQRNMWSQQMHNVEAEMQKTNYGPQYDAFMAGANWMLEFIKRG